MRSFYFKEKPIAPLRNGGKTMKKHVSVKNLFIRIFLLKCYESIRENERKRGKHIQDAERLAEELRKYPYLYEIGNKRYEEIHRKKKL